MYPPTISFALNEKWFSHCLMRRVSETMKSLIFYPFYKLTSLPASFMSAGKRPDTPGSETQDRVYLSSSHGQSTSTFSRSRSMRQRGPGDPAQAAGCVTGEGPWASGV